MALKFSFHGPRARNPFVRAAAILLTLLIGIAIVAVGAALILPILLFVIVATGLYILTAPLRRRGSVPPPRPPRPPQADAAPVDEEARLARAKPVERV